MQRGFRKSASCWHASQAQEPSRQEAFPAQENGLQSYVPLQIPTFKAPTSPRQWLVHITVTVKSSHFPKGEETEYQILINSVMDLKLMLTSSTGLFKFSLLILEDSRKC